VDLADAGHFREGIKCQNAAPWDRAVGIVAEWDAPLRQTPAMRSFEKGYVNLRLPYNKVDPCVVFSQRRIRKKAAGRKESMSGSK